MAPGVPTELIVLAATVGLVLLALAGLLLWPHRRRRGAQATASGDDGTDARKAAALRFVGGPLAGQSFALDAEVTSLGSTDGASIVVPDPDVAGKHLAIRRHAAGRRSGLAHGSGRWTVEYELADLGSIHGVLVNGQRMAKRVLASGDIIRLGTSEMVFRIEKVG